MSQATRDLSVMGPWAPMIVVLGLFLVPGLDIALGGADDDRRIGYLMRGMFAAAVILIALGTAGFLFAQRSRAGRV